MVLLTGLFARRLHVAKANGRGSVQVFRLNFIRNSGIIKLISDKFKELGLNGSRRLLYKSVETVSFLTSWVKCLR